MKLPAGIVAVHPLDQGLQEWQFEPGALIRSEGVSEHLSPVHPRTRRLNPDFHRVQWPLATLAFLQLQAKVDVWHLRLHDLDQPLCKNHGERLRVVGLQSQVS